MKPLRLACCIAALAFLANFAPQPAHAQSPVPDAFNPRADGAVYAMAIQSDGKILVGGEFTTLGGQPRLGIGRLTPDGDLDAGFNPGQTGGAVTCLFVEADGKVLVGGGFTTLGGQPRRYLARLNADGTLDSGFNPQMPEHVLPAVYCLAVQADGSILVGGSFDSSVGGEPRRYLVRLNADGTLDSGFNPGANYPVLSLALQPDAKILVAGRFGTLAGQARSGIGRLNPDGTVDNQFNPGANGEVYAVALQADGKILVGGEFTALGGQPRQRIGRLHPDGTLDSDFNPGANGIVSSFVLQADGKILVGGSFTTLGGQARNYLGRLNPDGTLDQGFNPRPNAAVLSLAIQPEGKVLVGGSFTNLAGQGRSRIARLSDTEPATQSLTCDGTSITWLRAGSGPEVWGSRFEISTDRITWHLLGHAVRVAGGWHLSGVSLPEAPTVRARGYAVGGQFNGSGWFVDDYWGALVWLAQPESQTNNAGTTALFRAVVGGTQPMAYQWFKDDVPLTEGSNVTGATSARLTLSHVLKADAGSYYLVVSNAYGVSTSAVASLTVNEPVIATQLQNQHGEVGQRVTFSIEAFGTALRYQWWKDGVALAGRTQASLTLNDPQLSDAGSYWVVVTSPYGSVTSSVALLRMSSVALDRGFDPGANGLVFALAAQGDGRILVGGNFTTLGGQARNYLGRLNPDGSLDGGFNPGAGSYVYATTVQPDGKILVGGGFLLLGGQQRVRIGRLNPDGSVDSTFSPANPAANSDVTCLAVQADRKILVGGAFTTLAGQPRNRLGRLNPDATPDSGFNPGADGTVYCLAVQPDGKILVGGDFSTLGGQSRVRLGRLNPDGTVDSGFNPEANAVVYCLAVQADGKVLVGGAFTSLGGQSRNYLGRLNADGTLDTGFDPGANASVHSLVLQADGKIVVGGSFTNLAGQPRNYLGRINPDGTLDQGFNPWPDAPVFSLASQADGKILVGGSFTNLAGQVRSRMARLHNTEPARQSLTYDGSSITWLRGGTSPEVWRTTFELWTGGTNWNLLGGGTRVTGGWQLPGISLPTEPTLRARGMFTGGRFNGSGSLVQDYWGRPVWMAQPVSRTNDAGTSTAFCAMAEGATPLSYQWFKDGVPLSDEGKLMGTATPQLTLSHVFGGDAGGYYLVASNAFGVRTSLVATLTVNDPALILQPQDQNRETGQLASLHVGAVGTALSYQWWKDGTALSGQTEASLTLSNLQGTDAGRYWVVVTSPYASVTSRVGLVTVNTAVLDQGFKPAPNGVVYALASQPDGKMLIGGNFTWLEAQTRNYLGRLNPDGSLDPKFNPGALFPVHAFALQADGGILVGGQFTWLGGQPRNALGRLNPDGSLDVEFQPLVDLPVHAFAMLADGKVLVGGEFTWLGGQPRTSLGRLSPDGNLDDDFAPECNGPVYSIAVQPDGRIIVGGGFTTMAGQPRRFLGRLNPDGSLNGQFDSEVDGAVRAVAVQADGKILVGGEFMTVKGQPRQRIARLNADGTLDSGFRPGANDTVFSLILQADGKILVGGSFTNLAGQTRAYLGRLHPDGTPDETFNPGANGAVSSLAMLTDGSILVGGSFTVLQGLACTNLGRLTNTAPASQTLAFEGTTITWLRGGTSPEVWRTTFERWTEGVGWTLLGHGTRLLGGWQLPGVSLPAAVSLRARGYTTGGRFNGSAWLIEEYWGLPAWTALPKSRTNDAGTTATFSALAAGTPPLSYQWLKDGLPLADGDNLTGAATTELVLSNVFGADAGGYSLVASNAFGVRTSLVAILTVNDPIITAQPQSQNRELGESVTLSVGAVGTALGYQWWKDGAALEGRTTASLTLSNLQMADAGRYWAVVSSPYGSATSSVVLLTVNGATLDLGFNPGTVGLGAYAVYALAVQTDGKLLVGGDFSTLLGQSRSNLARLNLDGTFDHGFNPQANAPVTCLIVQPDGKIVVGGLFTTLGRQSSLRLGRLNPDGTLDAGFDPKPDAVPNCLALQPDGKILVGGWMTTLGGQPRNYLGRLNPDATVDSSFNPGANGVVNSILVQADGKIVVGGTFTTLGGGVRFRLGRLNRDGTLDQGFNPEANRSVFCLAVQADGKLLVSGEFTTLGGQPRNCLGRLNPDGTVDSGFNPVADGGVFSMMLQADGRILLGGAFTTLSEQPRAALARLNPDGTLDTTFRVDATRPVYTLAVQPNGQIVVGGMFTNLGRHSQYRLGRLNNTDPATQSLTYDDASITWRRGGSSPEVWRTTFEVWTEGTNWTLLGNGTYVSGGWQLAGISLPTAASLRARGDVTAGRYNGSTYYVEDYRGLPGWVTQPASRTNNANTTATFQALGGGKPPLSYQWFKDGLPLADGGNRRGATATELVLSNVFGADAGAYAVVVSNAFGLRTSVVATLTVNDPVITAHPQGRKLDPGQSVTLSVTAVGTALTYQWWKNGAPLAGATGASLALTGLQATDGGVYSVVVSSPYGRATSSNALLTVNGIALDSGLDPGADSVVSSLAVQPDGKLLLGGVFTTLAEQRRERIARLNADGTLDSGFNPGADGNTSCLVVQPDGRIVVGGAFNTLGSQPRRYLGRLHPDGSLDSGFDPGADSPVYCLAFQPDGKLVVGGAFTSLGGQAHNRIGRLNPDGTADNAFNPAADAAVNTVAVQPDGKILVGGFFTTLDGQPRQRLGRLHADGTLDSGFNPGANSVVYCLGLQADGKILVGGSFTALGGSRANELPG